MKMRRRASRQAGSEGVLPDFEAWLAAAGVETATAIQLVNDAAGCSGLALGVQATKDIAPGDLLATIPKAACLSIRSSQLSDVIAEEQLVGGEKLRLGDGRCRAAWGGAKACPD